VNTKTKNILTALALAVIAAIIYIFAVMRAVSQ
jgi:hypothetical protein